MLYVGISRNLSSRCSKYRNGTAVEQQRAKDLTTLSLPHLTFREAHDVEEALIANMGPRAETRSDGRRGQLLNRVHSIRPFRADYCDRLLVGQYILKLNPLYVQYARAFWTLGRSCPGTGTAAV